MASLSLFDQSQARHFCTPLAAIVPAPQSLSGLYSPATKARRIEEGTNEFQVHRVTALNAVERWLLYSVAHYRRSLDMFVPAAAPWAQVTLYYSSFFAANAILGMFGAWVGHSPTGNRIIDVEDGTPGQQVLKLAIKQKSPFDAGGSHRQFWDFFYDAVPLIKPWAVPDLAKGLDAVNGDRNWQIDRRNDVNYDMSKAWQATIAFQGFRPNRFRQSLAPNLASQIEATEGLVKVALAFAADFKLHTFGYDGCGVEGTRVQIQRRLVAKQAPNVVNHSGFTSML